MIGRTGPLSVIAIGRERRDKMSTPATIERIVVGVDGSPQSKVAVDWAARDAACGGRR